MFPVRDTAQMNHVRKWHVLPFPTKVHSEGLAPCAYGDGRLADRNLFDLSQIPGGKLHYLVRKDQSCFANYPTHREFERFECLNCDLVINYSSVKLVAAESPNE